MKTQISRDSHQPTKGYSGVYQQQGRMITDADWNEATDVLREGLAAAIAPLAGNGVPRAGGVRVQLAGNGLTVTPGVVAVDGRVARVGGEVPFGLRDQPGFAGSPLPAGGNYFVYADVWDRVVTCLEDDTLRDIALHGVDTCTRTQTMAQVKWLAADPLATTANPCCGNAPLTLSRHDASNTLEPVDPCAGSGASGPDRTGNFLFRLEVHAVEGPADQPTGITLKWSSENGAEQFRGSDAPAGWSVGLGVDNAGLHVFERFTAETEQLLGVHLHTDAHHPARPDLTATFSPDSAAVATCVRRWDGYAVLRRGGGDDPFRLERGRDRGIALAAGASASADHGVVAFEPPGTLVMNLHRLRVRLGLKDHAVVAGDFWLAPVRELAPDAPLLDAAPPDGVRHRYLPLAKVGGGVLSAYPWPEVPAPERCAAFPPLSDLRAGDVGYRAAAGLPAASPIPSSVATVQAALDALGRVDAAHVGYTSTCAHPHGVLKGFGGTTVAAALERLCGLSAANVGLSAPCSH